MEVSQDIYLKFTQNGASSFLKKIKKGIPAYYVEQKEVFKAISEPEDWKGIDGFLHEKNVKRVKKILYDEVYLFSKHGEKNHTGEIKLDVFKGIFEEFFKDELAEINRVMSESQDLEEDGKGLQFLKYGHLIKKKSGDLGMVITKIPTEITQQEWAMYSFWEENELDDFGQTTGRKIHGVLESFIKFEDTKVIVYYMNSFHKIEKFVGKAHFFESNEQIYVETELMPLSDQRWGRFLFLFGKRVKNLSMGIFYHLRKEGALFSNSAILLSDVAVKSANIADQKCILHYNTPSSTLNHFFERRSQNYLKLPRIADYDLNTLQDKLSELLSKSTPKDIRLYKHDFFISVPMSYIDEGMVEYNKNKKFCYETIELLKHHFHLKINYFACKDYDFETYQGILRETHYEDSMEGIAESKLFVLLLPDMQLPSYKSEFAAIKLSSVWAELGYAIGLKKAILILCDKSFKEKLPNIVHALNDQIMIATPDMINIIKMKSWFDIPVNKLDIDKFLKEKRII